MAISNLANLKQGDETMIYLMLTYLIMAMLSTAAMIASFTFNLPIIAPFAMLIGMLSMGAFVLTFLMNAGE